MSDSSTVVVLDKDPFFRDFQRFLLSGQGFQVEAPAEPKDFTADYIAGLEPRLIVTEILLPGKNGLDLIRELRELPALQGCRIVVFSVLHAETRAMAAGADSFVRKPMTQQPYLQTVVEGLRPESSEERP